MLGILIVKAIFYFISWSFPIGQNDYPTFLFFSLTGPGMLESDGLQIGDFFKSH